MDDRIQPNHLVDEELTRRLDAYDAALRPDPAAVGRLRAGVVRAAEARAPRPAPRRLFGGSGVRVLGDATRRPRWSPVHRPLVGLAAAALLALVAVGGAFAATAPGAPLYGARLWLENATLPSEASARTAAEIVRLDDRLAEAQAAAHDGNGSAVAAAIDAYRETLDAALQAAGGDLTREQRLQLELERHRAVLEALVTSLAGNGNASSAIRAALARNADTIDRIVGETPAGPAATGAPANGGGAGRGGPPSEHPGNASASPAQGGAGPGHGAGQGETHPTKPPASKGPNVPKGPNPSKTPQP